MQSAAEVIKKLKELLDIRTDLELAKLIKVKPNTISSWKSRETLQYDTIIQLCQERNINLNELFFDDYEESFNAKVNKKKIGMISIENQLQYYICSKATLAMVPAVFFPTDSDIDIAFQLGRNNMQPTIKLGTYAMCKKISNRIIHASRVYVLVVENRGILCNRFKGYDSKSDLIFSNDNDEFEDVHIKWENIKEIFLVNGTFLGNGKNL